MRQSVCLVVNPIAVYNFASLFNCTPIGHASDSVMDPTLASYFYWLGLNLVSSVAWPFGDQLRVFYCSGISVVLFDTPEIFRCHYRLFLSNSHL